jgi:Ni,Fe-hydrogenase III small subunit
VSTETVRQRLVAAAVVVLLVTVGFAIGHETAPTPTIHVGTVTPTRVESVAPWTPSGALSPQETVEGHETGSCWTGSIAVIDSDAWRCMSGNFIYDPCFAPAFSLRPAEVACVSSPWSDVVVLRMTKPLPASQSNPFTSASESKADWALQLANRDRCVIGTGTNSSVGGVIVNYYCTSGALAGALNTGTEPWTVEYYAPHSDVLHEVRVKVAWGG